MSHLTVAIRNDDVVMLSMKTSPFMFLYLTFCECARMNLWMSAWAWVITKAWWIFQNDAAIGRGIFRNDLAMSHGVLQNKWYAHACGMNGSFANASEEWNSRVAAHAFTKSTFISADIKTLCFMNGRIVILSVSERDIKSMDAAPYYKNYNGSSDSVSVLFLRIFSEENSTVEWWFRDSCARVPLYPYTRRRIFASVVGYQRRLRRVVERSHELSIEGVDRVSRVLWRREQPDHRALWNERCTARTSAAANDVAVAPSHVPEAAGGPTASDSKVPRRHRRQRMNDWTGSQRRLRWISFCTIWWRAALNPHASSLPVFHWTENPPWSRKPKLFVLSSRTYNSRRAIHWRED